MANIQLKMLAWFIPSELVEWLKGNKRLLGFIQLVLWLMIFGLPAVKPEWAFLAEIGKEIQALLISLGIDIGDELFISGQAFSIIGLFDYLVKHGLSDIIIQVLEWIEKAVSSITKKLIALDRAATS